MFARFRHGAYCAALLLLWHGLPTVPLCSAVVYAQPTDSASTGIVVLRNGQVLAGHATQVGDRYVIELAGGSEIKLPANEVERACRDLDDAYQQKRKAVPVKNATAQLDLAEWCLRQNLFSQTAEQLVEVMAYAPENKRLAQVEERLRSAAKQATPAATTAPATTAPTTDQLEQTMRGLAPDTLERFVDTVQPLLLNRCAASGCHGSAATSTFKLMRPGTGASLTRRVTQQNLYAIMQRIDRAAPEKSPLVTAPAAPHGTAKTAIFTDHEARLREQLADWVRRVAQPDALPGTAAVQAAGSTANEKANKRATMKALFERYQTNQTDAEFNREAKRKAELEARRLPVGSVRPAGENSGTSATKGTPANNQSPAAPPSAGQLEQPQADPLDPEVFNRQFSEAPTASEAKP